ncbi:MAG: pilus assembly protein PilM [Acidobacteria bacterium]|nr:pilus assembly protein PilM [Acidobacteriota bacterium]
MPSLPAWLRTPPPTLGLHLDAGRVTAVQVDRAGGATPVVRAVASAALPDGALVPSLTSTNILQRQAVVDALRAVVEQIGGRPRRVAVAIADTAAKVSLLPFEQVPAQVRDLEQLVRLQLRKSVPFPVEDAQVTWARGGEHAGFITLVVTAMRRDLVEEYEQVCAEAGLQAGTIDLATFNVINLASFGAQGTALPGDSLLVHVTATYASIAVLRDGALIFFRTRPHDAAEPVVDVVHQTRMFYEDRLAGQGFARVLLVSGPDAPEREALARNLAGLFDTRVSPLSLDGIVGFSDRVTAGEGIVGALAAPAGLVLREDMA